MVHHTAWPRFECRDPLALSGLVLHRRLPIRDTIKTVMQCYGMERQTGWTAG